MTKALVIDDEASYCGMYERVLEGRDHLCAVHHLMAALELLEKEPIDLVIASLDSAGMDEAQFVQQVRDIDSRVPLVLVSSEPWERKIASGAGPIAFLQKPFSEAALNAAISEAISLMRSTQEIDVRAIEIERLRIRNEQLQTLVDMAAMLAGSSNVDHLFALVTRMTTEVLNADRATMFMFDEEKNELWSRVGTGLEAQQLHFPASKGIAGRVARTGETLVVNDTSDHPDFMAGVGEKTGYETHSLLAVPMRNSSGAIIGVFETMNKRDPGGFTESDEDLLHGIANLAAVRLENALLMERLLENEKLTVIGQLSRSVNHEIKNLLSSMTFLEMIQAKYPEDETVAKYVGYALDSRNHAKNILDEIRDIAKPSQGYEVESVNLAEIAEQVVRFLRFDPTVIEKEITLDLGEGAELVQANAGKIKQVLINLIRNAAQAIDEAGEGAITIRMSQDASGTTLSVEDTGPGIPEDHLERIWKPFFSTKGDRGTGLGLDICRKIIEAHGGTITCESELGRGTTFRLFFPRGQ